VPHRLDYLANTFALRTIPIVHPYWGRSEWRIIRQFLAGEDFPSAAEELEGEVCRLTGARFAMAVNLGRSAIQVALEGFKFSPESEVIVPTFACTGVVVPVIQAGLQPVLVDVDTDFNASVDSVREALSDKTRAVIFPHLGGKFARGMGDLLALAKEKGLRVIDDACQSFGLQVEGRWAGTFGDVGVFSFGGGKTLFGPGGGVLVTNDERLIGRRADSLAHEEPREVYRRVLRFAWRYGLQRVTFPVSFVTEQVRWRVLSRFSKPVGDTPERYSYPVHRIAGVEAALALSQVRRYREIIERNQANAAVLLASDALRKAGLQLPDPSAHSFTKFIVSSGEDAGRARHLQRQLRGRGVQTGALYTPLHLRPPFARWQRTCTPQVDRCWQGIFELPIHPSLDQKDMTRIVAAFGAP